ncbi:MAG: V-type ATPase subunit [Deltaproteobacteria bacterium]
MDLAYYNARIRGMRRRLLKADDYHLLVRSRGYEGLMERLRSTAYGPYLEMSGARFERHEEIVSNALQTRLEEALVSLWSLAPGTARQLLKQVFSIWEAHDIKTLVRGISRGARREDILAALIPAGEFGKGPLGILAGSPGIKELAGFLDSWGSPYAEPVKKGLPAYLKGASTIEMEVGIDRLAFSSVPERGNCALPGGVMAEVSALSVDMRNTLTLINTAGRGYQVIPAVSADRLFCEGGSITGKRFGDFLRSESRASLLNGLSDAVRDPGLRETLRSADPVDLVFIEESFYAIIERKLSRAAAVEPLGIYLSAAFAYTIVREVKNLRLIARAKGFGIPDDSVERLLLTVH